MAFCTVAEMGFRLWKFGRPYVRFLSDFINELFEEPLFQNSFNLLFAVTELPFLYSSFAICALSKLVRAAFRPLLPLATKGIFEPIVALVYPPDQYEPYLLPAKFRLDVIAWFSLSPLAILISLWMFPLKEPLGQPLASLGSLGFLLALWSHPPVIIAMIFLEMFLRPKPVLDFDFHRRFCGIRYCKAFSKIYGDPMDLPQVPPAIRRFLRQHGLLEKVLYYLPWIIGILALSVFTTLGLFGVGSQPFESPSACAQILCKMSKVPSLVRTFLQPRRLAQSPEHLFA
ncbi:hypothetical protein KFL_003030100 [Klebsormidium nitens]|uniref:Uncharacterized protein n=1 Tax=Klebsormidium nitens TaxID=105231 RepID=A0A1Y1ID61_KLENI|nr:hypothetical protein KFL_003030100 [Klebsormidium nitens]|eukprot:GAQ86667.1 hypothetical protein KFL_003030100 [Klebsormidium nitens]